MPVVDCAHPCACTHLGCSSVACSRCVPFLFCSRNPNTVKLNSNKNWCFFLHTAEKKKKKKEFLSDCELPKTFSIFPLAFKDRSRAEIKPLTESPLAVNCTDRIRFNTALDFLSPPREGKKWLSSISLPPLCLARDQKRTRQITV